MWDFLPQSIYCLLQVFVLYMQVLPLAAHLYMKKMC